ncbi:transcriptional regulator, AraC family [Rhodococcus rhodochrous J3]|uniref:Helix-turn-helix transcriptional regulator n=2 Tax=Rhodococcus rhodochrous TaxID=1829 RepID=A0AA46WTD6_RHORH|nr:MULTISPECIES: helix-turn-helix transcriptional regulator [Rhodococcus]AYA23627.1 AraC family transcriptional regulator [Rhodococcus rhodochrous]MBF4480884.1 helix-turn-helix transcriptional regulator [Rhodococcus rhodochrous]MCB8909793.1 helix-turn-helix transcriptional regulator [Rhodococcus rhodochrous]MCD2097154.1 helix-turn-helix transcriptional regulator [Rhodococcus rhodochrous]MCD2120414.1 helix-turn-helix transcriptional regulator [Rhodococcus rhodochrous]
MTFGRDRLRELLDAVLDENNATLERMAQHAYASQWHFSRTFAVGTGESPVALRRRVMLERAAWQLRHGSSVTDAAFAAGYDSVEGFARAFARAYGYPPSAAARVLGIGGSGPGAPAPVDPGVSAPVNHWLPAPNGVHFHPPTNLWVEEDGRRPTAPAYPAAEVLAQMVQHDLADTRHLLARATELDDDERDRIRFPGLVVLEWDGPEESVSRVLGNLVRAKEMWLASMAGADHPEDVGGGIEALTARFEDVAPRWVETIRDIHRRGAWGDILIDALCDPPESFVLGGVVAHVLTFAAHRRQLVRHMMRAAGLDVDHGDPLDWNRSSS